MSSPQRYDSANTIAFMGVEGANADLACRKACPYMHTLPLSSFEAVFEAVEKGEAALGMIPIENTQAGRVAEIHHILPRSNVHIVGEHFERIEHHLLGVKGASLAGVTDVYSHPQALLQCRQNLLKMGVNAHPHSNTATAAADVAKWGDPSKAAIASALAGGLYGLEVLQANIEDSAENYTLFVMIAKDPIDPDPATGKLLTSVVFTLRNIPAALYKALGGFATNAVNLLKLESYIPGASMSQEAQFFITFEGHSADRPTQLALEELGFFTKKLRVLGTYPADAKRFG